MIGPIMMPPAFTISNMTVFAVTVGKEPGYSAA